MACRLDTRHCEATQSFLQQSGNTDTSTQTLKYVPQMPFIPLLRAQLFNIQSTPSHPATPTFPTVSPRSLTHSSRSHYHQRPLSSAASRTPSAASWLPWRRSWRTARLVPGRRAHSASRRARPGPAARRRGRLPRSCTAPCKRGGKRCGGKICGRKHTEHKRPVFCVFRLFRGSGGNVTREKDFTTDLTWSKAFVFTTGCLIESGWNHNWTQQPTLLALATQVVVLSVLYEAESQLVTTALLTV